MKVKYTIKPRVKLYFFGLFSRIFYDLIEETTGYHVEVGCKLPWKERIATYSDLESAEKGLKRKLGY